MMLRTHSCPKPEEGLLRKTIALAIAGALTLALAAVAVASPQFSYSFATKFTQKHPATSTGFKTDIETSDPGNPQGVPKGANVITVTFPKGTKFNPSALPKCAATPTNTAPVTSGACDKAKVGTGSSVVQAVGLPSPVPGTITAYNANNAIIFYVKSVLAGTTVPVVLKGNLKGTKLTTDVGSQVPNVGGLKLIITTFKLNITPHKKGKKIYATTPKKCTGGKWVVKAHVAFDDGTVGDFASAPSKCLKK
jgi:hypothetical protein